MGRSVEYAIHLLRHMIENKDKYFDKMERLNSEGFKILNKAIEALATEKPGKARILKKARKKASLEDVIKTLKTLTSVESV